MYIRQSKNPTQYNNQVLSIKSILNFLYLNIIDLKHNDELVKELELALKEIGQHQNAYYYKFNQFIAKNPEIILFNYIYFDELSGWFNKKEMLISKDYKRVYIKTTYKDKINIYKKFLINDYKVLTKHSNYQIDSLSKIKKLTRIRVVK